MSTSASVINLKSKRPASRPRATRPARRSWIDLPAAEERALDYGKSASLLDEAHRRLKNNMRAIPRVLSFGSLEDPLTREEALSEMENRLQSMAGFHKALSRAGNFEQIDLAVFLNHVAKLRQAPPQSPLPGGWVIDEAGQDLFWKLSAEAESQDALHELDDVLRSVNGPWRETAMRALYACAIVLPPWSFKWRTPREAGAEPANRGGEVSVRLRLSEEGVAVEVELSERGPGLPDIFGEELKRKLALDITSVLTRLIDEPNRVEAAKLAVVFDVAFATAAAACGSEQRLAS